MLSTTAAGSMLRIEEVCTRQDAHLEAFMADFRSFADDLDQRQPSKHASFALLDDDDNNDKDNAIHIILLIDDTDVELEDIAIFAWRVTSKYDHSESTILNCYGFKK